MVHVHGRVVLERAAVGVPGPERIAVPVDVGKHTAMAMVADFTGERLVAPFTFSLESIREFQVVTNAFDVEWLAEPHESCPPGRGEVHSVRFLDD
jgi:hypothetical protein